MRNQRAVLPLALLALFGLSACGDSEQADQQSATEQEQQQAEQETMTADTGEAATERSAQQPGAQGMQTAGQGDVALTVEESQELGEYVADQQGRPVYVLEADTEGQSKCTGECAQQWPPVVAQAGQPTAMDPQIDESKLSTIQREDGVQQVTYDGHPLYYYVQDSAQGEPSGQDKQDEWGEWYLVSAEGEPLDAKSRSRGSSQK